MAVGDFILDNVRQRINYPLPRPDVPQGWVNTRLGPVPLGGTPYGPPTPTGIIPALPAGEQLLALNPAPEVIAHGGVPGQLPNFIAQGTVPGQPIAMGPVGQPTAQATNLGAATLAPNSSATVTPQLTKAGTGTYLADPSKIDLASLRDAEPRVYQPRGNLEGGTFLGDGAGNLGPRVAAAPDIPSGPSGPSNGGTAMDEASTAMSQARMGADTRFGTSLGRAVSGMGIGQNPLGGGMLPEALTRNRSFKGSGLLEHLGVPLAGLAAQGFVDANADPNKSIGPINKGTLNSTLGGVIAGGGVAGVPGGIAGGVGAGVGDVGSKIINADGDNMNPILGFGLGALRGLAGPIIGGAATYRDATNQEATGGLSGLFSKGGKLEGLGGLVGMGGGGEAPPEAPKVKPQEMLDRAWDFTQTDPETRQAMQIVKDLRIASGEDEKTVAQDMLGDIIGLYQQKQKDDQDLAKVAAQQQQALKYMAPYTDSMRLQGQMESELLNSLLPTLPAAYQGYGQMMAGQATTRANTLADAYMAQAAMAPSQAVQQRQQAAKDAYDSQLQQQIQAIQIQNDLAGMQAAGSAPVPISQNGGI